MSGLRSQLAPSAHYSPLAALQPAGISIVENSLPASTSQPSFACASPSGFEFIQSRLNGNTSDRGICHRLALPIGN